MLPLKHVVQECYLCFALWTNYNTVNFNETILQPQITDGNKVIIAPLDFYTNTSRKNKIVSYLYYRTTLFKGEIRRTSIGCGKKAIPCRIWQIFKQPLRNFCYRMKLCSYNLCSYCHKTVNYRLIILKYDKVMWIKHGNPTVLMGLKIFTSSKETRTSKNRTAKFSLQQSITNCTFNVTLRVQSVQH